ncbi:energy transducer TonB [Mucilaginibacter sp. UR6-1]|uniref:M56 family metallopeptidase n=1 Tax=Mucilaginibacter sp. UR6-1 TaxID=1435643 RepID=UPI001E2FD9F2|nr:M56 family metallopeptidase [Mucilaginibacter sp. UR6-1]MCC8410021.1 energy transducer TonB [Mucilaginibacter sp. UR6-1]
MNWLYYLLEANLYLAIFYAVYLLILRNETFYTANRWYLLTTSILAFVLPVIQIGWLKPAEVITQISMINFNTNLAPAVAAGIPSKPEPMTFEWTELILPFYLLGSMLAIILFAIKLTKLYMLVSKSYKTNFGGYELIEVDAQNTGFSFFRYLFIGKNTTDRQTIITHELVHIRQNHSADIVFSEFIKIVSWFNPLVYMLQNSLKTVHEYIADEHTAHAENDSLTYSSFLLNNVYGLQGPAAANSFFNYNLLKNRIIMLNKPRSGSAARLKYLMTIPIAAGTLCLSTLSFSKNYPTFDLYSGANEYKAKNTPLTNEQHQADTGLRLPAPDFVKKDFITLTNYLSKHIKFPSSEINKIKFAGLSVSFDVDKAGTVGDVRLLAPAKNVLGNAAVSAFNTFSGKLNVKPGTYIMGVNFVTLAKNYVRFPEPSITKNANFIGTVTIVGLDKEQKKMLKEQSVSHVKRSNSSVQIPQPKIERVSFQNTNDNDIKAFNKHLSQHIAYPKADYDNKVTGRVFAQITTNANNEIEDVRILRAPSKTLEDAVVRAIKSYKGRLPAAKTSNADYTVPVSFNFADKDGSMLTEKSIVDNNIPKSNLQEKNTDADNAKTEKLHYSLNEIAITAYLPKN